jgi:hypothetical protein
MLRTYSLFVITAATLVATGCARNQGSASRSVPTTPVYTGAPEGVIPAGTELALRANETISTDTATAGRYYSAEVAREIRAANGDVVVPQGSPAQLMVVDAGSGGAVGTPNLQLGLQSITVNGRTYPVETATTEVQADKEGLGTNRRTAEMVGGGAVLGAVIGAIAGGGTGAAIGGAVGAAGGAAAQVLTRGDRIRVPAESVITFRLDNTIRLRGYQR